MKAFLMQYGLALLPLVIYLMVVAAVQARGYIIEEVKSAFWQAGAVVTVKSSVITNRDATPSVLSNRMLQGGEVKHCRAQAAIANGDSIASKYLFFSIPSNAMVVSVRASAPDIGTTTAGDVGLYKETKDGGAVVDADFFKAAVVLNAGAISKSELVNGNVITVALAEKRVWELLGLTADPDLIYDVVLTLTGAADAAGNVELELDYVI